MTSPKKMTVLVTLLVLSVACHSRGEAPQHPVELTLKVATPFRFVAYGDTRFTNPADTDASNPEIRRALVKAIADVHPAFVSIGGDISYVGADANDWKIYDTETAVWKTQNLTVYPALGNHDLKGKETLALANYFQRFPELRQNRYYSVRAANVLMLVLDSSLEEVSGPQGQWLASQLDAIPSDIDFVVFVMHHPPYTTSSDAKEFGGGHSARPTEQALAQMLEQRQQRARARFVVFSGHVHNYERHEHSGVTYFVTGGGGAHAYPIPRSPDEPYRDHRINYHYLLVEVEPGKMKVTMNRLELQDGKENWTQPDSVEIAAPKTRRATAARGD